MAHRTKTGQETHDNKVGEVARRLSRQGYQVQADLPGHRRPRSIGGRIPDILATKSGRTLIREVETPRTVVQDRAQHSVFRSYASQSSDTEFRVLLAKKKKK